MGCGGIEEIIEEHSSGGGLYLLLKANGGQIPLSNNSVSLVIATPPYFGESGYGKWDFCTTDPEEYARLMTRFLTEATRIVRPRGHILLILRRPRIRRSRGHRLVVFEVLQKRKLRDNWIRKHIKLEKFLTHYVDVKYSSWWALPVRLYRSLLDRYSRPGEIVAHVFSGSGNSGIAALELARKPILIDLYYHRRVGRRLDKKIESMRRMRVFSSSFHLFP
jgi:DNA modification methylase